MLLYLTPPGLCSPGRLESSFYSFVGVIGEAAWPEVDLDNNLSDTVILGMWDRLPRVARNLLSYLKCLKLRINTHTLVTHTFVTRLSKSRMVFYPEVQICSHS